MVLGTHIVVIGYIIECGAKIQLSNVCPLKRTNYNIIGMILEHVIKIQFIFGCA
jgi:hypothetical protein